MSLRFDQPIPVLNLEQSVIYKSENGLAQVVETSLGTSTFELWKAGASAFLPQQSNPHLLSQTQLEAYEIELLRWVEKQLDGRRLPRTARYFATYHLGLQGVQEFRDIRLIGRRLAQNHGSDQLPESDGDI